jgi:hypothetical protein
MAQIASMKAPLLIGDKTFYQFLLPEISSSYPQLVSAPKSRPVNGLIVPRPFQNTFMNLTNEQHDLLRAVVALYDAGDTSQFIVNRTLSSGSSPIYSGGHPPVPISADDSDFK